MLKVVSKSVSWRFQGCYKGVPGGVPRVFQGYFKGVSWVLKVGIKAYQGYYMAQSRVSMDICNIGIK